MNILIIESDRNRVVETLGIFNRSKEKENIYVVADGRDALDFIYREGRYKDAEKYPRPDFVLLGAGMHRSIGFVLREELKARRNNLPVFLPPIN